MPPRHLNIMGLDYGGTTGWGLLVIPRESIFGDEPPEILEWDYGEFQGDEPSQAVNIARLIREVQGLDYPNGPAVIGEAWDIDTRFKSTDQETLSPVRLGAMLMLLQHQKLLGDATLHFQPRSLAKSTATDTRLKRWGLYVPGSDHQRDAIRHAITGLRRARENSDFAKKLWPR